MKPLAEKMHEWYLEVTKNFSPDDYNSKAQVSYSALNENQRIIDKHIAKSTISWIKTSVREELRKQLLASGYNDDPSISDPEPTDIETILNRFDKAFDIFNNIEEVI